MATREAAKRAAARSAKPNNTSKTKAFASPATVTLPAMLADGNDLKFRETIYLMALAFDRLHSCREAFGRALALTASQFIVLIGTAHRQGHEGVTIRTLAEHTQLAATHVTTEVGRLIDKGLLVKEPNSRDRRSVLVRLTPKGEAAIHDVNPLLRRVNDRLFQSVTRGEFDVVSRFFAKFARNSEEALFELRRAERDRGAG